jgi:sugar O-acyltransferase (sialic acid O-acetyltransferase NeuD family)
MCNTARPVVILGGASGAIVAEALYDIQAAGGDLYALGYLNDIIPEGEMIAELPVLGPFTHWRACPPNAQFISVLHKAKEAAQRINRIAELGIPPARWALVRHPSAQIARSVPIGPGTFVGPNAVIMPGAAIGEHASLRPGCSVSHDTSLGNFTFVGPNVTLNGNCTIGDGVHLGPNTVIREETSIGDLSVIGMGSVVLEDVPDRVLAFGTPARIHQRLNDDGEWVKANGA